jgi:hypothetical protein
MNISIILRIICILMYIFIIGFCVHFNVMPLWHYYGTAFWFGMNIAMIISAILLTYAYWLLLPEPPQATRKPHVRTIALSPHIILNPSKENNRV